MKFLPTELRLMVAECTFSKPCKIRRHIVEKLLQQWHRTADDGHSPTDVTSHVSNIAIRNSVCDQMDYKERHDLKLAFDEVYQTRFLGREWNQSLRLAERDWLRNMPMDIRTFQDFCSRPNRHGDRQVLILELFPRRDFCDPPPELSDPIFNPNDTITAQERQLLHQRQGSTLTMDAIPADVDHKIYKGLTKLWLKELPHLPKHVKRVEIIAKDTGLDVVRFGVRKLNNNELYSINKVLTDIDGRDVWGGLLI